MSGIVDVWCDGCRYVSKGGGTPTCEYMTMTGWRRGCPAGNGCTKRERPEGWKPQRILHTDEQWFRMPALKKAEQKARHEETRKRKTEAQRPERKQRQSIIREWRKAEGLTQRQVAERIGMSEAIVCKWECGEREANWALLRAAGMPVPEKLTDES